MGPLLDREPRPSLRVLVVVAAYSAARCAVHFFRAATTSLTAGSPEGLRCARASENDTADDAALATQTAPLPTVPMIRGMSAPSARKKAITKGFSWPFWNVE